MLELILLMPNYLISLEGCRSQFEYISTSVLLVTLDLDGQPGS
jgi:hypothetical protein